MVTVTKSKAKAKPRPARTKLRGLKTLDDIDGRSFGYRHAHAVMGRLIADLGGDDNLIEGQRRLVQRAAVIDAMLESDEADWLSGNPIDVMVYLARVNSQRRLIMNLGLKRVARDITPPTLDDIRAELDAEKDDA